MVAMIVIAELLIVEPMVMRSGIDTLPQNTTIAAPTEAGMASFNPFGRHMIRTMAIIKAAMVSVITAGLNIGVSLPSVIDRKNGYGSCHSGILTLIKATCSLAVSSLIDSIGTWLGGERRE